MKLSKIHILVFSEKNKQTRRLSVPQLVWGGVLLSFVLGLIGLGGALFGLQYYREAYTAVRTAQEKTDMLGERRELILAEFDKLEVEIAKGEKFTDTLQSALGLETGEIKTGKGPIDAEDRNLSLKFAGLNDKVSFKQTGKTLLNTQVNTEAQAESADIHDDEGFLLVLKERMEALQARRRDLEDRINELYLLNEGKARYSLSVPDRWPVHGWLTSNFGFRHSPVSGSSRFHAGLDIASPVGTPVSAPSNGVVVASGWKDGYGQMLVLDHGFGFQTLYGHNSKLLVKEGDYVRRGQKIALVGMSGRTTGPHLHYEVHVDGIPANPLNFMSDLLE